MNEQKKLKSQSQLDEKRIQQLVYSVSRRAPYDAVILLERESDEMMAAVLKKLEPTLVMRLISHIDGDRFESLTLKIDNTIGKHWSVNQTYPEDSIGRIMEPVLETFPENMLIKDLVEALSKIPPVRQVNYAYVVDKEHRLVGVVVMRDLLFARSYDKLSDIMIEQPFYFKVSSSVEDAMRAVLLRHYPIYPVCDDDHKLVGLIRGYAMFEHHTYELTAQSGQMVGVEKEEHLSTPWYRCLLLRHPWLQLNLLTAFMAGAVVGLFDETISKVVVMAAFLPVLAGQSGNTGCQALAVTLRGMTLNELKPGMERKVIIKEVILGTCNGLLVGITAGLGMFFYALSTGSDAPVTLAAVVIVSMLGACIASGIIGVLVPLTLRRFGADPATASTIFLTTATDIISMGLLLLLATVIIL